MVRIPGFHPGDPGSIPGRGNYFFFSLSPPVAPSGVGGGEEKKIFFVSFMSACAQRETKRKNIFFLPQWLPVMLPPLEAT